MAKRSARRFTTVRMALGIRTFEVGQPDPEVPEITTTRIEFDQFGAVVYNSGGGSLVLSAQYVDHNTIVWE